MFELMKQLAEMLVLPILSIQDLKTDTFTDIRDDLSDVPRDNDTNGLTYYVDGNAGDDGNDGLAWEEDGLGEGPMATLAAAITASNLTIATHPSLYGAGWAARNRIYCKGDMLVEDLTVLAQKCDIIGVGSHDSNPMATLQGNHAIGAAGNHGCRFFNMRFTPPSGGGDIFTIPTTTGGVAFYDCVFDAHQSTKAGGAIVSTGSHMLRAEDCRFIGQYTDAVIELGAGAGADTIIKNNWIEGANQGIDVNASFTTGQFLAIIEGNTFETALACINDASGLFAVVNNTGITLANRGYNGSGAIVASRDLSVNNHFTCADVSFQYPEEAPLNVYGGRDYYVDLNIATAGDGLSWDTAFDTIAAAIAASNTSIGLSANRWWARRNQIFVCGDGINEDLTVLPEKCDIIGVGADLYDHPRVLGNHVIAAAKVACRFINMGFNAEADADIFDIPAGCYGLSFIDCDFTPMITGALKALEINDAAGVRIENCNFQIGAGGPSYFDLAIHFEGTIHHDCVIKDCVIVGVAGIQISQAGANCFGSIIQDNVIRTTSGLPIDDNSDDWMVVNNRWITEIDTTASTAGYDLNLQLACGNIQMGASGLCDTIPFAKIAE